MSSRIALAFALIASMVIAGTATAGDYGRSGWYLGAGGGAGWDFFDQAVENAVNAACGENCLDVTAGGTFNFRGGYRVNSWFAAEAMYEGLYSLTWKAGNDFFAPLVPQGTEISSFDLHNFLVNVKFIAPIKRFQPYFIFGVGAQYHTFDGKLLGLDLLNTSRTDFVFRPGVGMDLYITESWLFNTEIGVPVSFKSYSNIPSSTTDNVSLTLSFGLTYRF